MLELVKIRLPISRDTAYLIENPEHAVPARESLKPEVLATVRAEVQRLTATLTAIDSALSGEPCICGEPRPCEHVDGPPTIEEAERELNRLRSLGWTQPTFAEALKNLLADPFKSYCQTCVYQTHPVMLTGYCLTSQKCDRCGTTSDLAMVKIELPGDGEEDALEMARRNPR